MKKFLGLLSVLTISGTAVPTTIAVSSYEKKETKLENIDINYLQSNNSKSLNRNKRSYQYYGGYGDYGSRVWGTIYILDQLVF